MARQIAFACAVAMLASTTTGCATFVAAVAPQGPPADSASAERLERGPNPVRRLELDLVDAKRPTPANRDYAGAPTRTLTTALWAPRGAPGPHPLVIYSHGFFSGRREGADLAEHLASHGYVVAAPDFPLSRRGAPGGATLRDLPQQAGDVAFVLDALLGADGAQPSLEARIDPQRVAAVGLSLGGLTSTLVAFHPELRDPRIGVAVSIAGPGSFLTGRFFASAHVPYLVIAGTEDAIVAYRANALPILERSPDASLLTLAGGSHVGFAGIASAYLQFRRHPDAVACRFVAGRLPRDPADVAEENPLELLGGPEQGISFDPDTPLPCTRREHPRAMRPRRQQIVLRLAVRAFLDSALGDTQEQRNAAWEYLSEALPGDFPEVGFATARGSLR